MEKLEIPGKEFGRENLGVTEAVINEKEDPPLEVFLSFFRDLPQSPN